MGGLANICNMDEFNSMIMYCQLHDAGFEGSLSLGLMDPYGCGWIESC